MDRYIKPELQSQGYETNKALGRVFPDAYRQGEIVEIKPYHAGIDPYVEYGQQINSCLDAYRLTFPGEADPIVRFILYRLI